MSRSILVSSLFFSVAIEVVLWGVRSGPGWLMLVLLGALLAQGLRLRLERPLNLWTGWLWLGATALASGPALYDAQVVHWLAPPLCALTLALAMHYTVAGPQSLDNLPQTSLLSLQSGSEAFSLGCSACPAVSPSTWRGLRMALPLLGLFGLLFVQADPAYSSFITRSLSQWESGLFHLLRGVLWAWLAASVFLQAQWRVPPTPAAGGTADPVSWATALHSTNLLFVSFLVCQAHYLFAGRAPEGMTLANYARHGFFELFTATLLVVGLVVWVHHSVYASDERVQVRLAALALVTLTFGLAASSALRMSLYVAHFGFTLTRAYVLATLVGIVATLLLGLWALLHWRHPAWLQARLLLLGMLSLAGVGLTNVEAWVGRVNLARPEVDYEYLGTLSCDLLPALDLQAPAQRELAIRLQQRAAGGDWRSWNWSRQQVCNMGASLRSKQKTGG